MALVLVVDDNKGYGEFLERLLERFGCHSFRVADGEQALRFTKKFCPDLILLDVVLAGRLSGLKTLKTLKLQETTKRIPVIMISGERFSAEDESEALDAGASLFLAKTEISDRLAPFKRHVQALILKYRHTQPDARPAPAEDSSIQAPGRVLVVEDDPEMRSLLACLLQTKGYTVMTAATAVEGLDAARYGYPDLIILDKTLPDGSGLDICSQLKNDPAERRVPVMVLTGDSTHEAKLAALRVKADDFMTKPMESGEKFLAVAAALLERRPADSAAPEVIRFGDVLLLDPSSRTIVVGGRKISNMPTQPFRLAWELASNPGKTLGRDHLVTRVYDGNPKRNRNIDTGVKRIKKILGEPVRSWIECVRGQGYRLVPDLGPKGSGSKPTESAA